MTRSCGEATRKIVCGRRRRATCSSRLTAVLPGGCWGQNEVTLKVLDFARSEVEDLVTRAWLSTLYAKLQEGLVTMFARCSVDGKYAI